MTWRIGSRPKAIGFLLALLMAAVSCAPFKGYPDRPTEPAHDLESLKDEIDAKRILDCLNAPNPRECRNRFVAARVYAIDLQFARFEQDLFRQARELGFAATVATLGLSGAGALVGGGTSQILSAAAAGVTGSRAAVEREILGERTLTAIHTAMRGNRAEVLARIRTGLQKDITEYPLGAALTDVEDYYFAGTVLSALIGITKAVGVKAAQAEEQLSIASGFSQSLAARALRRYLNASGISEAEKDRRLMQIKEAAREEGVPDANVGSFISDETPANEEKLERVARRLGLLP